MGYVPTRDEAKAAVWAQLEDLPAADQIRALEEVLADMRADYARRGLIPRSRLRRRKRTVSEVERCCRQAERLAKRRR